MNEKEIFKAELDRLKGETAIGLSEWENGVEHGRMEIINALYKTLDLMQEEPEYKVGDTLINSDGDERITVEVGEDYYKFDDCSILHFNAQDNWALVRKSTSVWHDASEEPLEDKQVMICLDGFCFVDFYHKKDRRFYMFCKPKHYLHEIDKWAYTDELLKL